MTACQRDASPLTHRMFICVKGAPHLQGEKSKPCDEPVRDEGPQTMSCEIMMLRLVIRNWWHFLKLFVCAFNNFLLYGPVITAQTEKRYRQHLLTCAVSLLFPSHLFWLLFLIELYVLLLDICIMHPASRQTAARSASACK